MKSGKKTTSLLLSLLLVLSVLPVFRLTAAPAYAAGRVIASGDCGFGGNPADVRWTLTDDRVLTFTGTGAMEMPGIPVPNSNGTTSNVSILSAGTLTRSVDIVATAMGYADEAALNAAAQAGQVSMADYFDTLAYLYQTPVDRIVVGEGITELRYAALRFAQVDSISLPSTLVSIGDFAFAETRVDTLTIPANVVEIGAQAFSFAHIKTLVLDCAALSSVGDGTLAAVRELKEIVVNSNVDFSDLAVPVVMTDFRFTNAADYDRYLEFNTVYQLLYQAPYIIDWAKGTDARIQTIMTDNGYDAATAAAYDRFNSVPSFIDGFNRLFGTSFTTVNDTAAYCHDYILNKIGVDIQNVEDVIETDEETGESHFTDAVNDALLAAYGIDVATQHGGYVTNETCRVRDLHANGRTMLPWITVKAYCGSTPHAICVAAGLPYASLGHHFGPWTETRPATATEDGEEQRTCDCDAVETRPIPATGANADPQPQRQNVFQKVIQFFLSLVNFFRRLFGTAN